MQETDPLDLEELGHRASKELRKIRLLNRVLYVAHVVYGKSLEDLSAQTGRPVADIRQRIDNVLERLQRKLQ